MNMGNAANPAPDTAYLIFDVESIPDGILLAKTKYPGQNLSPEDAISRAQEEARQHAPRLPHLGRREVHGIDARHDGDDAREHRRQGRDRKGERRQGGRPTPGARVLPAPERPGGDRRPVRAPPAGTASLGPSDRGVPHPRPRRRTVRRPAQEVCRTVPGRCGGAGGPMTTYADDRHLEAARAAGFEIVAVIEG